MHNKFLLKQAKNMLTFVENYTIIKMRKNNNRDFNQCAQEAFNAYRLLKRNGDFDEFANPVSDFAKRICNY